MFTKNTVTIYSNKKQPQKKQGHKVGWKLVEDQTGRKWGAPSQQTHAFVLPQNSWPMHVSKYDENIWFEGHLLFKLLFLAAENDKSWLQLFTSWDAKCSPTSKALFLFVWHSYEWLKVLAFGCNTDLGILCICLPAQILQANFFMLFHPFYVS